MYVISNWPHTYISIPYVSVQSVTCTKSVVRYISVVLYLFLLCICSICCDISVLCDESHLPKAGVSVDDRAIQRGRGERLRLLGVEHVVHSAP